MDEMDELSFIHFSYLCNVNQCNSETMSKKRAKNLAVCAFFPIFALRIRLSRFLGHRGNKRSVMLV